MSRYVNCDSEIMKLCKYGASFNSDGTKMYCNYLEIAGKLRGCDPTKCTKFKKATEKADRTKKPMVTRKRVVLNE